MAPGRVRTSYADEALTTPKSGKVRSVPMAPDVAEALAKLGQRTSRTDDDDPVFVGQHESYLDGRALRRRYDAYLKRALVAEAFRVEEPQAKSRG